MNLHNEVSESRCFTSSSHNFRGFPPTLLIRAMFKKCSLANYHVSENGKNSQDWSHHIFSPRMWLHPLKSWMKKHIASFGGSFKLTFLLTHFNNRFEDTETWASWRCMDTEECGSPPVDPITHTPCWAHARHWERVHCQRRWGLDWSVHPDSPPHPPGLLMAIRLLTASSLPATLPSFQSGSLILSCSFHLNESFPGKIILWALYRFLNLSVSRLYDLQNWEKQ